MKFLILSSFFFLLLSCTNGTPKENVPKNEPIPTTNNSKAPAEPQAQEFSVEVIEGQQGWGYHILLNNKLLIRQPNIPSLPGNKGFDSQEKAQKVANYILYKIQNGIMPPTVLKIELDSLGVL